MYKVYILQSERNGRYYIGFTKDIESRLDLHNRGKVKSTRYIRPLKIVYTEDYDTATEARQREHYLKTLKSRQVIQNLINQRAISSAG
ncbi:MAG: GIY-YIG nuclease family protein [Chloroflexi bacterium]|nr:GIY-YIG nuclease family protein [Chloroflexota bacterium]